MGYDRRKLLLIAASAPAVGLLLAAFAPTGLWPAVLARHWAVHLALLSLPLWCWQGRRTWVGVSLLVVAIAALWPWTVAAFARRASPPGVVAATAQVSNLHYLSTRRHEALAQLSGDIVALIESMPPDREELRHDPRWPYQRWVEPRNHGGMALLSRWPMHSREDLLADAPLIDARIDAPWGSIRVIAMHTSSPGRPRAAERNRRQLAELAALAETEPGPLLVLGDLNAAPADSGIAGLREAGLLPPAGGEPATWPMFLGPCGITIDHAFVHRLRLGDAQAVWLPGSDHRGLRFRFGP